jgi:hypothetical protein
MTSHCLCRCQRSHDCLFRAPSGHVWTAPDWQELLDVDAALVGCGHVSRVGGRHHYLVMQTAPDAAEISYK